MINVLQLQDRTSLWRCSTNEVHVHLILVGEAVPADVKTVLSREEWDRANRYAAKSDQHLFLAAHYALRMVLAGYLREGPASLEFRRNMHGKPSLREEEIQFNMSHSHGAVAIAVCTDVVGIDIEYVRQGLYSDSLGQSVLAPLERDWLLNQEDAEVAFYRIWTLKEAAVKADGRGLSLDSASIAAFPRGTEESSPITIGSEKWWGRELSSVPGFCLSIVTRQESPIVIRC